MLNFPASALILPASLKSNPHPPLPELMGASNFSSTSATRFLPSPPSPVPKNPDQSADLCAICLLAVSENGRVRLGVYGSCGGVHLGMQQWEHLCAWRFNLAKGGREATKQREPEESCSHHKAISKISVT